jgi:hypothetical protein
MVMAEIDKEIAAYEQMREELEKEHMGKWVLFHHCKLIDFFSSFESAAEFAVAHFGNGPYLIRQIGAPPITFPASVMYRVENG